MRLHPLETRVPPPLVMLTAGALMYGVARRVPLRGLSFPGHGTVGVLLMLAGALTALTGVITFARSRTTIDPLHPERASQLVTHGIFARSRNPMYLGMLLVLAGWSVRLGSVTALLVVPAFVAYITRFQIAPEERVMRELFGEAFDRYRAATRRWV